LGSEHSAAVSSLGKVFTWGNNRVGQLGIGRLSAEEILPQNITTRFLLSTNERIIDISLGREHSMALSSAGKLFTWGGGGEGRLGTNNTLNQTTPVNITTQGDFSNVLFDPIRMIEAGLLHSGARTQNGRLFVWGAGGNGRLGLGTTANQLVPKEITRQGSLSLMSGKIQAFSLGFEHTLIANDKDRIYSVGLGANGRLGNGTDTTVSTPVEISLIGSLINISNYNRAVLVMNLIANLPSQPRIADQSLISAARQSYQNLNLSQQSIVNANNYARLVDVENKLRELIDQYQQVIALFNALPVNIRLEDEQQIQAARQAYNALNDEQKAYVQTKLTLLTSAESKLATLYQQIEDVIVMILQLPNTVTMDDEEKILQTKNAYFALSESQRNRINSQVYNYLLQSIAKLQVLLDQIAFVIAAIEAIPSINVLRINEEDTLISIRQAYEALVPKQKERIPQATLAKLFAAEIRMQELKAEVEAVRELILNLPASISLADENLIIQVRHAYNNLHSTQQSRLSNEYYRLLEAEAVILALKEAANEVDRLILALPAVILLTHEPLIVEIQEKYALLNPSQRNLLLHFDLFLLAEEKINDLIAIVNNFNLDVEAISEQVTIDDKQTVLTLLDTYDSFDQTMKERTAEAYAKLQRLLQSIRVQEGFLGFIQSPAGMITIIVLMFAMLGIIIITSIIKNRPKPAISLKKVIRLPYSF
jgi:hypothetical protein